MKSTVKTIFAIAAALGGILMFAGMFFEQTNKALGNALGISGLLILIVGCAIYLISIAKEMIISKKKNKSKR